MNEWRLRYCLIAPVRGCRSFSLSTGMRTSISRHPESGFHRRAARRGPAGGKVRIPIALRKVGEASGRSSFLNFPDREFGVVNGVVSNISLVPTDEVLYGGYRCRGSERQLRYRPARLARDASLRGDRNGRITPDRTILPPDQTDRERRILV